MIKNCAVCKQQFEISDEDKKVYQKFDVPEPKHCPNCRKQRQIAWRNESYLYRRKCNCCGKNIISIYHQNIETPIYCQSCWWSDNWDPKDFSKEFDFTQKFFPQFEALRKQVPRWSKMVINGENSEYCINGADVKNCYLTVSIAYSEDCLYCNRLFHCKNCVDCLNIIRSELCYECIDSEHLYNSSYCQNCTQCTDTIYALDCKNCKECMLSVGLRHKKYHILNQPYSEEEYKIRKSELLKKEPKELQKMLKQLASETPHTTDYRINCENCSGNFIFNSKNVHNAEYIFDSEDSKFIYNGEKVSLSYDCTYPDELIECYQTGSSFRGNRLFFCENIAQGSNSYYCSTCSNISDCFGCVGLKRANYCILNKQYSKEEYEKLLTQIITHMKNTGEWGDFFPMKISPFAYNETVAHDEYPLSKKNTHWRKIEKNIPAITKKIPAEKLPNSITQIPDDVLNWAISCQKCSRPYKIQKTELGYYRKRNINLPKYCPTCRMRARKKIRKKL